MTVALVVFLSAMVIAYALVALATVNIWRPVPHSEDPPERLVGGGGGRMSKHRCSEAANRSPARGRVRRSHRRRRY